MKQIVKTLLVFTAVLALVAAFAGCPEDNGGDDGGTSKPTGIVVKKGGAEITSLELEIDEEVELTVSATGATEYYWDIKSGSANDVITLTNDDTATVTITGKKEGPTTIVAYAENDDGVISKEITVQVFAEMPQLVIKKVLVNGTEKATAIDITTGDTVTLSFEVEDDGGTAVTDVHFDVISSNVSVASISELQVKGEAAGNTTITITASKSHFKSSDSVTRDVSVANSGGGTLTFKILDDDGETELTALTLTDEVNADYTFDYEVDPSDAAIGWVSSDDKVVKFADSDGKITVVGPGTATITATASKGGMSNVVKTVSVTVIQNPALIFAWDYVTNGGVDLDGKNWTQTGTPVLKLKGKGKFTEVPLIIKSGNTSTALYLDNDLKGIRHDGTVASMMALLIGAESSTDSTCDTVDGTGAILADTGTAPNGVFKFTDYLTDNSGKKIQISIGIDILAEAGTGTVNRSFGIYLNNSQTGGAFSPLNVITGGTTAAPTSSGNAARIGYWLKSGTGTPTTGAYNTTNKIFTCSFDKDGYTDAATGSKFNTGTNDYATLNKAFFQIQNMGNGGNPATDGAKIVLSSIRIELVD